MDEDIFEDRASEWGIKTHRGDSPPKRRQGRETILDLPKRERMKTYVEDFDGHDTSFKALYRMLQKGIGKPWGVVYSEIIHKVKQEFPFNLWHEIINRIPWYVETNPMDIGNGVYVSASGHSFNNTGSWNSLMVHPETGILMKPKEEWCSLRFVKSGQPRWIGNDTTYYFCDRYFRQINGIWYEVEYVPIHHSIITYNYQHLSDDPLYKRDLHDCILKVRVSRWYIGSLASAHGYLGYSGHLVSDVKYRAEQLAYEKKSPLRGWGTYIPHGKYIYAKKMWQIGNTTKKQVGINIGPSLEVPDIVR